MSYQKLKIFIEENSKMNDFSGGIKNHKIEYIESILKLKLPLEYKNFLCDFGYLGLYGVEIYGYVLSTNYNLLVEQTFDFWSSGLSKDNVVTSNEGEYIICLDVNTKLIKLYDLVGNQEKETNLTFSEYYLNRLQRAKEDFELYG